MLFILPVLPFIIYNLVIYCKKQSKMVLHMQCHAFCTAQSYKLPLVYRFLKNKEKNVHRLPDAVYFHEDNQFAYFFSFGAAVFWGLDQHQEQSLLEALTQFSEDPLETHEVDHFTYEVGKKTVIDELTDTMIIQDDKNPLYKLSLSYALGQSVKLSTHERDLKLTMTKMSFIPKKLATTGKTSLKAQEIAKKMGELYLQKSSINSNLNFLHTPKTIWDTSKMEPYYQMAADYLDLHTRTESLNMGLSMIQDLLTILQDQLNHRHSSMLEWIIILLIFVEVVLFLIKDIFHLT